MSVREQTLDGEYKTLSPFAKKCRQSAGRERQESPCPQRTDYQRDRDRVIHSHAFRRLMHKTQVFLSPRSEHLRNRLTHTLEVSQIARTIARSLRLNEDLTEAIALAHDLGHTPFGHAGESVLDELLKSHGFDGFRHYEQSVRVVKRLEKDGRGLNLTEEVIDGILHHGGLTAMPATLEGTTVRLADKIAYLNHDMEDAAEAGLLRDEELPREVLETLGRGKSERITALITAAVQNSIGKDTVAYDPATESAHKIFRDFMFKNVYKSEMVEREQEKARKLLTMLFERFIREPELMSDELYLNIANSEGVHRAAADYIAGMTDEYALRVFDDLYVPKKFGA
ncbi:deoxyguanosinetriphosphate triphosphohydrolase-like protein [Clostridia bacterium]|nr:deoxyguanosinetriphosphate triphosphohydrolase-like protein [Clostridia bacterium]